MENIKSPRTSRSTAALPTTNASPLPPSSSSTVSKDNNNTNNPGTVKRRTSVGGFPLLEQDDFHTAMGKLLGTIPLTTEQIKEENKEESSFLNKNAFWNQGPTVDITPLLHTKPTVTKRTVNGTGTLPSASASASANIDHAIDDPNPEPSPDSLAFPPPTEIMQPAGNMIVNRRIEATMLHNEVSVAQKIANDPVKLAALLEEKLFQQACTTVGFPIESLRPAVRTQFKTNPQTGRHRKKDEIDQLMIKADIDRIKKLALVLTDYRILLAEAEKARRKEEKEAKLAAIAAAQKALQERHEVMSMISMPESFVSWNTEKHGIPPWASNPSRPGTGNGKPGSANGGGRQLRPEDKYPAELLARYGYDALETYGVRALECYGVNACEKYGVAILDKYNGVDLIERFGLDLLDLHGVDACLKFGAEALRTFPRHLLDQYGVSICEKYPTDLLLLYSPDILDVWPHPLLREFPIDVLSKYPIDLLRRHPVAVLERHSIAGLRKYPVEHLDAYGETLLGFYDVNILHQYGREICQEAMEVNLPPEKVYLYRKEKGSRLARIGQAQQKFQVIKQTKEETQHFVEEMTEIIERNSPSLEPEEEVPVVKVRQSIFSSAPKTTERSTSPVVAASKTNASSPKAGAKALNSSKKNNKNNSNLSSNLEVSGEGTSSSPGEVLQQDTSHYETVAGTSEH